MNARVANVLSIAGSDPSAGAGIHADLKTFAALGVYGCAVLTALTAQNTIEVSAVMPVPPEFVRRQLDAVFSDVRVDAVKIGLLGTVGVIREVVAVLRACRPAFVVLDPVLRASTGRRLLEVDALDALRDELLPLVTLATPNVEEAGALLGIAAPQSVIESREAAVLLTGRGAGAVLVTGGHLSERDVSIDVLHDGVEIREFRVPRVHAATTHGTGCTLSSAVAALLARGHALSDACCAAQRFVAASIARGEDLSVGRGRGPVHQLGAMWACTARGGE